MDSIKTIPGFFAELSLNGSGKSHNSIFSFFQIPRNNISLESKYNDFYSFLKSKGYINANDQCCTCDNGYMCNPDSPPPGCGTCSCFTCP